MYQSAIKAVFVARIIPYDSDRQVWPKAQQL
jgi:hypothetical protein